MRVVFVHGACVRDGSWWWHLAAEALRERGIGSAAPALPSCGEGDRPAGPQGPGLPEDVAAVRAVLSEGDEPTVVVAHSYGGIVAAEAAAGVAAVRHLVLVSSYLPEPGSRCRRSAPRRRRRSWTSTPTAARSAPVPNCSPRRSSRTARPTSPAARRTS
ncbi:alpha/beta fold hydrolase [Actinomadura yumaensis]|uniref:alpha/beta fold hydrolase n=1 Tax=Actinomadura yumaensis TaxID=111807 RepID=UPI00360FDFDF